MAGGNGSTRRGFIVRGSAIVTAGVVGAGFFINPVSAEDKDKDKDKKDEKKEAEVTPTEDLMQEHGVLKRVLLVYRESVRRLDAREDLPVEAVARGARIIREFVEDYHEKNEENFIFPRLEKAGKEVELVKVLRAQHEAGRRVTDVTMKLATVEALRNDGDRQRLVDSLRQFIRMYEPHEAREDTVLFPAFRSTISQTEFEELGEKFEDTEHTLFGGDGFEKYVDRVAGIEKELGIYELDRFTPKL
jgi:hemerythrin-like domain-containing protein